MYWLDQKYISILSPRLERFKRISASQYNFRCPLCGDSKKNKAKARGYFIEGKGQYRFYCHNCHVSLRLEEFIRTLDVGLADEYIKDRVMEKINNSKTGEEIAKQTEMDKFVEKMKPPKFVKCTQLKDLKKISQLNQDHPAARYVFDRLIPTRWHSLLFYCPKFFKWTNTVIPGKFDLTSIVEEPRLIIPFIDADQNLFGFQGRSFAKNSAVKYITILLNDDLPPVFGMNKVDLSKPVWAFEGPIDSMFIPNSIATSGSDIVSHLKKLDVDLANVVVVYDNEPRNKDTIRKMETAIKQGFKVAFWPDNVSYKDINEWVKKGKGLDNAAHFCRYIEATLANNTLEGLSATLRLSTWRKM